MNAHGVKVFHIADGNDVALSVAHDLVFNLLPAGDAFFNEHLMDGRKAQTVGADLVQLLHGLTDAAARAAHGERRAHDDRVTDLARERKRVGQALHHLGGDNRLAQLLHGVLEELAVLGAVDGVGLRAQQAHAGLLQITAAGQLHGQVQARLAAQVRQDGIRLFLFNDAPQHRQGHRLHIHAVRDVRVRHNGGGVGVDEHHLDALAFQRAARLRAGVVELGGLADDDGAAADDEHLFDRRVLWHFSSLLSS